MPRKIVFLGNCQANSLRRLFAESVAPNTGDDVGFVACFAEPSELSLDLFSNADIIVSQILDSPQVLSLNRLRTANRITATTQIVEFPFVSGSFLWPHACPSHIFNHSMPFFGPGPYGQNFGNSYLNREILRGTDLSDLTKRYAEVDISKQMDLDRLYELYSLSLQKKDGISGFRCAQYIDDKFRENSLFRGPSLPNLNLYLHLAETLFEKLDISNSIIRRVCQNTWTPLAAHIEFPIHPSVIRHFKLKYAHLEFRHRCRTEEVNSSDKSRTRQRKSISNGIL